MRGGGKRVRLKMKRLYLLIDIKNLRNFCKKDEIKTSKKACY